MRVQHSASENEESKLSKCTKCEKSFETILDLEWHDETEHTTCEVFNPGETNYSCKQCTNTYPNFENLEKAHGRT